MSAISNLGSSLQQLQQLFSRYDTDKNASLSQTEFESAATEISGLSGNKGQSAATIFKQLDTDGDGKLNETELKQGADLAAKVQEALLKAQEIMSGGTLLGFIGKSLNDSSQISSIFGGSSENTDTSGLAALLGNTDDDTSSTDAVTALLQQLISKYNQTADSATEQSTTTQTA